MPPTINEQYGLVRPGKNDASKKSRRIGVSLRYELRQGSVGSESTSDPLTASQIYQDNLFITGDNLPALYALLNAGLRGTVKFIYIDPPYNTGNDFAYHDKFTSSHTSYAQQSTVGFNPCQAAEPPAEDQAWHLWEEGLKHSKWLSMMCPRLQLARELLCEDG